MTSPSFRQTPAHQLARSRGFLTLEDVDLIGDAVRMLVWDRLVQVVDLGAGSGTTALSVFCARREDIAVLTVDRDPVALASTGQCMENAGFRPLWRASQCDSADVRSALHGYPLAFGRVDLLLVDADHSYEGVRADLAAWLPYVRPGSPVWCHDYTDQYPGCIEAVDEFVAARKLIPMGTRGWGILLRTPDVGKESGNGGGA